jgi:hypothetical protein
MEGANKADHPPSGRKDAGSQEHAKDRRTRRGQGYRGKRPYNNKNKSGNKADAISAPKEKFTGRCDDLEGYVYSVTVTKGGLQFSRTTKEIARYAGKSLYKNGNLEDDGTNADKTNCASSHLDTCNSRCRRSSHI